MTYLWIELIDASDGFFHAPILYRIPNLHPLLNHRMIHVRRQTRLARKFSSGIGKSFE